MVNRIHRITDGRMAQCRLEFADCGYFRNQDSSLEGLWMRFSFYSWVHYCGWYAPRLFLEVVIYLPKGRAVAPWKHSRLTIWKPGFDPRPGVFFSCGIF